MERTKMSLDTLLDALAAYVTMPETSSFSLPPKAYTSQELNDLEVSEIFERSWLCVGRNEYVPKPGDYFTINVMDEPMIIVRGADDRIRALTASCRLSRARGTLSGLSAPTTLGPMPPMAA